MQNIRGKFDYLQAENIIILLFKKNTEASRFHTKQTIGHKIMLESHFTKIRAFNIFRTLKPRGFRKRRLQLIMVSKG